MARKAYTERNCHNVRVVLCKTYIRGGRVNYSNITRVSQKVKAIFKKRSTFIVNKQKRN